MTRMRRTLVAALLALAVFGIIAVPAIASVRMRVTGNRTTEPVVIYVPRRATLLAAGDYAGALGVPSGPRYPEYGPGGPVYYGGGPYYGGGCGYGGCGGPLIYVPPYQWGYSPLDPPLPTIY